MWIIFLLKSPSSRIYWNSYWLPLQDKCKSHSLIFTIYQVAAAHFQQEISLTRTQTPLHLNSIFIVRCSLSSGRREKSCLSRGESWSKRRRWGEKDGERARAKHYWQGIMGWQKAKEREGMLVGEEKIMNMSSWDQKYFGKMKRRMASFERFGDGKMDGATNGSGAPTPSRQLLNEAS